MKKIGLIGGGIAGALLPVLALAQTTVTTILDKVKSILDTVIPILITLGVIYFIWGVIQYVSAKEEEKQKEARTMMISGIIGLFVIVAMWGLIGIIAKTFDVGTGGLPSNIQLPTVPKSP